MARNEEEALQKAIVQHLIIRSVPGVIWWHTPNGEYRSKRTGAKLKAMGVIPGVPDLAFILPDGSPFFMELKASKGRLSPSQNEFIRRLGQNQVPCAIVHSIDTALDVLEGAGVLRKGE